MKRWEDWLKRHEKICGESQWMWRREVWGYQGPFPSHGSEGVGRFWALLGGRGRGGWRWRWSRGGRGESGSGGETRAAAERRTRCSFLGRHTRCSCREWCTRCSWWDGGGNNRGKKGGKGEEGDTRCSCREKVTNEQGKVEGREEMEWGRGLDTGRGRPSAQLRRQTSGWWWCGWRQSRSR